MYRGISVHHEHLCCLFKVDDVGEVDEAGGTLICVGLPVRILWQDLIKRHRFQSTYILFWAGFEQVSNKLLPGHLHPPLLIHCCFLRLKAKDFGHTSVELYVKI